MDLFNKIHSDTTILTPNRRLSAVILKNYSAWQIAQNKLCWPTLDVIPLYPSWLERLWKNYSAKEITENSILLTTHQEQIIWEQILREAPESDALLQVTNTAKLAKSAWETLKRWNVNISDSHLQLTDDSRAFLNWANQFRTSCEKKSWLDQNSLADILKDKIANQLIAIPAKIILIGFTEIAPQYQSLLNTCQIAGSEIEYCDSPNINQHTHFIGLADTETEIQQMAQWAKAQAEKSNSVGCIIPNLETLRDSVLTIFSNVLGDQFNISAGKTLSTYPLIYDALQWLQLPIRNISLSTFSHLLHSPFLGDAEKERNQRAAFENRLRQANVTTLSLQDLLDQNSKYNLSKYCPLLAKRLKLFFNEIPNQKVKLTASNWVSLFAKLLTLLGWPGERSLNSHEYQIVQNAWLPALAEFATFDQILDNQNYSSALHYLTCLINGVVFQPESLSTPIQILGILEAAEIPFEHAWIMGLDDSVWPARPKPNPFIPLRLQKKLNMPNASAERELIYCQKLTQQLQQCSQQVLFSYPKQQDDAELRPSSLLKVFPEITHIEKSEFVSFAEKIYQTRELEFITDETAPPVTSEEILGGVKIFKTQAECPFKAFAELRLHAKKMDEPTLGLRKLDRGNMIHKTLELIWRELKDSNTLMEKSDSQLKELIHQSAQFAFFETANKKPEDSRYLTLELNRLEKIILKWLQEEKSRPAFTVKSLEQEITTTIGSITAHFRIDRIDELISELDAKQLIIDYKTGKEIDKKHWFGERLSEPQLPIYCVAFPDEAIGIAFAKINPVKMHMTGASKIPLKISSIAPLADLKQADAMLWDEQVRIWQNNLVNLGNHFSQGSAQVDPKDESNCRLCGLQPFCRIYEFKDEQGYGDAN